MKNFRIFYFFLVIVDADRTANTCHTALFNIGGTTTTSRSWNVLITQYSCGDTDSSGYVFNIKTDRKWMSLYKWPLNDLFWPFFRHMYVHLSQNRSSDGHFKVLNRSYLWLVQNLWQKTKIFPFLFFFQFCTKTEIFIFCVFWVFVFIVITFVPI